ncbi:MAG: hypothetical protein U0236_12930 [Nitrospira sp.]
MMKDVECFLTPLNVGVALITATFVFIGGITRPYHNWDMIGYVASAYQKDGYRGNDLLERTYRDVRADVSDEMFKELVSAGYRETVYTDPNALEQQIPFYSIRVAYLEMIRQLSHLGLTYSKSTYMISSLFSALSVCMLAMLIVNANVSILTLPIIALSTGIHDLARLSTPDAIACFLGLLCMVTLLANSRWSLLLVAIMPMARTDFILLSFLVGTYEFSRGRKLHSVIALITSLFIYVAINKANANYGWLTLFNFTFIGLTPYPADLVASANIQEYLRPYYTLATHIIFHSHFPIYLLAAYALAINVRQFINLHETIVLVILPMMFVLFHIALYPAYYPRFFVFSASVVFVWLLSQFRLVYTTGRKRTEPIVTQTRAPQVETHVSS